jgi:SAM-dependent methyltransferase
MLLRAKKAWSVVMVVPALLVFFPQTSNTHFLYQSQGVLGSVKVLEHGWGGARARVLLVNNAPQTAVHADNFDKSMWKYVEGVFALAQSDLEDQEVLILGAGGGTMVRHFHSRGARVTGVEIDPQIVFAAKKYFGMPDVPVIRDDARHVIATWPASRKPALVVYDVVAGVWFGDHLMTVEALRDLKRILNSDGRVIINITNGNLGGYRQFVNRLLVTAEDAGFWARALRTDSGEGRGNVLLLLRHGGGRERIAQYEHEFNSFLSVLKLEPFEFDEKSKWLPFHDDKPIGGIVALPGIKQARAVIRETYLKSFISSDLQVY